MGANHSPTTQHQMIQIEAKTFVSEEILHHEHEYTYGAKQDEKVDFTFLNTKTGKETTKKEWFNYKKALQLARDRRNDGRYKNYEYIIG